VIKFFAVYFFGTGVWITIKLRCVTHFGVLNFIEQGRRINYETQRTRRFTKTLYPLRLVLWFKKSLIELHQVEGLPKDIRVKLRNNKKV
jgi:hypothetical protein